MIILSAKEITKEYGIDTILSNVSFHVNEGDRVGIIGANGAGKTTLLKILTGEMPCESGEIFISQETTIGYLKQQDGFDSGNTIIQEAEKIFDELKQMEEEMLELSALIPQLAGSPDQEDLLHRYDRMVTEYDRRGGYTYKSELRGILNSMAFTEDQYDKPIAKLSGGERTRLSLALLLLKKPNL
ncbi:MAG: ATP-binding cassette domain-containing protein, partial [Anaerovoracaceae bacterium]